MKNDRSNTVNITINTKQQEHKKNDWQWQHQPYGVNEEHQRKTSTRILKQFPQFLWGTSFKSSKTEPLILCRSRGAVATFKAWAGKPKKMCMPRWSISKGLSWYHTKYCDIHTAVFPEA